MKRENNFINYAHRGASEYAPENTFLSFNLGVFMRANGIETDVQLTKDGVAVLFHDDTLERVTGEKGLVKDYTLEELNAFWVKKNGLKDKIPTLVDFVTHFKHHDIITAVELKADGAYEPTAKILKEYQMQDKVVVTSFKYDQLLMFKKLAPEFKIGYLTMQVDDDLLKKMKADGFYELCPEACIITAEKCAKWHELGFNVRAWGVLNDDLMKSAYFAGVDGMTVNFPDKLTTLLEKSPRSK